MYKKLKMIKHRKLMNNQKLLFKYNKIINIANLS